MYVLVAIEKVDILSTHPQLRSRSLNSHAGQVCFPGGASDRVHGSREEEDAAGTALRETEEELGVDKEGILVWGEMPPVGTKRGQEIHKIVQKW